MKNFWHFLQVHVFSTGTEPVNYYHIELIVNLVHIQEVNEAERNYPTAQVHKIRDDIRAAVTNLKYMGQKVKISSKPRVRV